VLTSGTLSCSGVTIEFQRSQAKQLVEYFRSQQQAKAAEKSQYACFADTQLVFCVAMAKLVYYKIRLKCHSELQRGLLYVCSHSENPSLYGLQGRLMRRCGEMPEFRFEARTCAAYIGRVRCNRCGDPIVVDRAHPPMRNNICRVFGFTKQNEIGNGRWVMFGFAIGLLTEYATGADFPQQFSLMLSYLGIADLD
jgi:hypothetical protein